MVIKMADSRRWQGMRWIDPAAAMKAKESHEAIGRLPSGTKREKFRVQEVYVPAPTFLKWIQTHI